jgi:hypothetical protein
MIQGEDVPWSKSISETHINIKNKHNTSSQPKEHIPDSMSFVEEKPQFRLETFCPSIKSQKVPLFATFNHLSGIKDPIQDAQEHTQLSLVTLKMAPKLELDCHLVLERLFLDFAEQQSELSPEVEEMKNR